MSQIPCQALPGPRRFLYHHYRLPSRFCDFIPDPHVIYKPSEQLCDGLLIEGYALIVMEYKASMFTTRAKYSGDHLRLRDEIAKKLVRDFA
jgi:hypothetical protein